MSQELVLNRMLSLVVAQLNMEKDVNVGTTSVDECKVGLDLNIHISIVFNYHVGHHMDVILIENFVSVLICSCH